MAKYTFSGLSDYWNLLTENSTTVNWAQLSNEYRGYVDTDTLPGSYPHIKYHIVEIRGDVTMRDGPGWHKVRESGN